MRIGAERTGVLSLRCPSCRDPHSTEFGCAAGRVNPRAEAARSRLDRARGRATAYCRGVANDASSNVVIHYRSGAQSSASRQRPVRKNPHTMTLKKRVPNSKFMPHNGPMSPRQTQQGQGPVVAAGQGPAPVGRKHDAPDLSEIQFEMGQFSPILHAPQTHGLVLAAGKNAPAVG